jgi:hypothetical protein
MTFNTQTAEEALSLIQKAWGAWAVRQIDETEFAARVADALEWCGMSPLAMIDVLKPDNDPA